MTLGDIVSSLTMNAASSQRDKIERGRVKLFDFDYPVFDVNYKKVFETHFIRKFYMREIGFETEGLFKFQLESWLLINMPYFNKLFESELIQYDPLVNSKMNITRNNKADKTQSQTSATDGTNTSNSEQSNSGSLNETHFDRQLESETPDSRLTITSENGEGVIEYASRIVENSDTDTKNSTSETTGNSTDTTNVQSTTNATINETEDYIESIIGKTGSDSYAKLMTEYRASLIRIENKIFDEMQELFMLVY